MSKESFYVLQIASTISAMIPLAIGLLTFRRSPTPIRLFLFFLLIGLITDLMGWYFYLTSNGPANIPVRNVYNLIEPVFLFWFVSQFLSHKIIKQIFSKAWIVLIPFWTVAIFYDDVFALFKTTSEVLLAFTSSFCLLGMVEKQSKTTNELPFWLLLGIFFYNFSTFFFMSLVTSTLGFNLWYLHNIINIITNLIYGFGFWGGTRKEKAKVSTRHAHP